MRPIVKFLTQFPYKFEDGQTRTDGDQSRGNYSPLQLPLCDIPRAGERI